MPLATFPDENLLDIFVALDRQSLERLQTLCRRFRRVIDAELQLVCLRTLISARLELRKYKTYVVEVEEYREPNIIRAYSCACGAILQSEADGTHFLSDWLIREKGLTKLKGWKPSGKVYYSDWRTKDTPRWCSEGRPLRAEDIQAFFSEEFTRTSKPIRGDCLIYCNGWKPTGYEQFHHVYYGTRSHCAAGTASGVGMGANWYEYYVDKQGADGAFAPALDQHFYQVTDSFDKAVRVFFAALRSSVVIGEVRISQVVLTQAFVGMLQELAETVRIAGSLSVVHTDARAIGVADLLHGFAGIGALNFENSTFATEQLDDAFLLRCQQSKIPSIVLPACPLITEDALLNYCFGSGEVNPSEQRVEAGGGQGRRAPGWRVLRLIRPEISSEFLRTLVEKSQEYEYNANVLLIALELDGFSEQINWAFHGNRLNADDVHQYDNERFPQYRFYFHGPNGARVLLDWCTAINGLVLQTIKDDENFLNYEWDEL